MLSGVECFLDFPCYEGRGDIGTGDGGLVERKRPRRIARSS